MPKKPIKFYPEKVIEPNFIPDNSGLLAQCMSHPNFSGQSGSINRYTLKELKSKEQTDPMWPHMWVSFGRAVDMQAVMKKYCVNIEFVEEMIAPDISDNFFNDPKEALTADALDKLDEASGIIATESTDKRALARGHDGKVIAIKQDKKNEQWHNEEVIRVDDQMDLITRRPKNKKWWKKCREIHLAELVYFSRENADQKKASPTFFWVRGRDDDSGERFTSGFHPQLMALSVGIVSKVFKTVKSFEDYNFHCITSTFAITQVYRSLISGLTERHFVKGLQNKLRKYRQYSRVILLFSILMAGFGLYGVGVLLGFNPSIATWMAHAPALADCLLLGSSSAGIMMGLTMVIGCVLCMIALGVYAYKRKGLLPKISEIFSKEGTQYFQKKAQELTNGTTISNLLPEARRGLDGGAPDHEGWNLNHLYSSS